MTAGREAVVLPLMLLTAALLASAEPGARLTFVVPSLYSLVLATLLIAALARSGGLDPLRLMNPSRPLLANANGAMVLASLAGAAASVLTAITPRSGLPRFFVAVFLLALLVNTLVARPDRVRLLRSIAVILGSGLIVKFVILAGLSQPSSSTTARVLIALFDAATFGAIAQEPQPAAAGYLAFAACALLLAATALLPAARRVELEAASRMQLPEA
jgi:hypothetical protein